MNQKKYQEQISDLLDDVLRPSDSSLDELLWAMDKDSDLRTQWQRYQLIGAVLRGELIHPEILQLADRVREHTEQLTAPLPQPKKLLRRLILNKKLHIRNWALAAAVMLLAFAVGLRLPLTVSNFNQTAYQKKPVSYTKPPEQQAYSSVLVSSPWQTLAQLTSDDTADPYEISGTQLWPRTLHMKDIRNTRYRIHGTTYPIEEVSNLSLWELLNRSTGLAMRNQCWPGTVSTTTGTSIISR